MLCELKRGLRLLLVMTVLTGLLYPLTVTGLSRLMFPAEAQGSLIDIDGTLLGSAVIGQSFTRPDYFQSRPSAAGSAGYDAAASGGTNLAATSKKLVADITARAAAARADYPADSAPPVPIDLVTSSGSGLDPHLSPAAALYQVPRIARLRRIDPDQLKTLIDLLTEQRSLGVLGEPRITVLKLNLALDELSKAGAVSPP
jgi:K+-transporting ATPase ATPase C chain